MTAFYVDSNLFRECIRIDLLCYAYNLTLSSINIFHLPINDSNASYIIYMLVPTSVLILKSVERKPYIPDCIYINRQNKTATHFTNIRKCYSDLI